ncbi:hypothetical protein HELRODRAFT_188070 [Helobdella robusta]|uniref:Uncharacterized protein n=1 Tax=Helobdella robusta TaxID=6412 RepID=T1FPL6_HELRO|nr:hypothetical protein HELRODRAFT_188070 [Helobdella robusta]ESO13020.1 hypothetical protein HELRODRAFT_188070 [Helobdella robusta]
MEASNQGRNNGDNISDDGDNDDKDNNNCDNGGDNELEKDDDKDDIKNDDENEREIGTTVGLTGVHVHFETGEDHHQDQHRDHHQDHRRNDDDHHDHQQHENLNKENNNDDNNNDNNTVDDPYEQLQLLRQKRSQRSEDGDVFYDKSPGIIEKDTSNNNQQQHQHEEQQQLQLSGRVSEKLEQLQEKFSASSSHKEANVVATAGKLKDGQIEVFEKFQHGVSEQGEQTSSSSKVKDVVLKGRANEIKEMLEKGSLNSSAANVTTATSASKTNHDVTDDVVPPPQQVRKKKADEWLTAVKHTPATSGAPTAATRQTTTPLKDNFWLRRETQQQQQPSNDKSPTITRVGRLNFEEKMALFGGGAKSGDGAASHKATPTHDHSYLNKTTTANSAPSYKTFKRDNSNTPNVVSYTSNSVKTDMKVSLVARNSNDAKNNMYLHLDRNGLVKLIEELKGKVSTLEQETSNLKLQLENRGIGRSGYMDDCRPATRTGSTLDNDQATDN